MRLAVLLLLACSGAREPEPPAEEGPRDLTTTCSPRHDAVGPACVPRFDACAGDALPKLGGGCEAVGDPGGLTVKEPVEACGAAPSDAVFVDGSYSGASDGTSARPYPTIAAALAVASTTVWIASGVYREDLVLDVEEIFDTETRARNAVSIADGGGNDCACGPGAAKECRAQTTGLLPIAIAE